MIPLELSLQNFFSYRKASLDFRGLHMACISGPNGAGKSSLLEAITWVLWGKSRAKAKDDVILSGETAVRVDFSFILNEQAYRVIRTHERGRSGSLDFQIQVSPGNYRTLSGKGISETEEKIVTHLKLDYDTFINSAYLRQGRADEFMLKGPADRKEVLIKILKLDYYDDLAKQAADNAKDYKSQSEHLENRLDAIEVEQKPRNTLQAEKSALEQNIKENRQNYQAIQNTLQELQELQSQRQFWEEQTQQLEQQYQSAQQESIRLNREQNQLQNQLQKVVDIIAREEDINNTYQKYLQLQEEEDDLRERLQANQDKQRQKQALEKTKDTQINQLKLNIVQQNTELEQLENQEEEIQRIIRESSNIEAGLKQLLSKREQLQQLDRIQSRISPLNHRQQQLTAGIESSRVKLVAELEQVKKEAALLQLEIAKEAEIRQQLALVGKQIEELKKKEVYLGRVEEKINEKKLLKQQTEQTQQLCKKQLQEIEQKRRLLDSPEASCPLCQSPLEDEHRELVIRQMEQQTEQIEQTNWSSYEENNRCNKELNDLEKEANQLRRDLKTYVEVQNKGAQIDNKLDDLEQKKGRVNNQLNPDMAGLENKLAQNDYSLDLQQELAQIIGEITQLNYHEQTHYLTRAEVEKLRHFEFKKSELEKAKEKQNNINQRIPVIIGNIESFEQEIVELQQNSALQEEISQITEEIRRLNYDQVYHQSISAQLRQLRDAHNHYQQLQNYKQELPSLETRQQEIEEALKNQLDICRSKTEQIEQFKLRMEQHNDYRQQIEQAKQQLNEIQLQLDSYNNQKGSIEQKISHIETLDIEHLEKKKLYREVKHKIKVYDELAKAFGKKGIQALIIENLLPQLETATNHILSRLTQNQLHVSFTTLKNATSGSKKNRETKTIDTLDILIADQNTTRSYEGYSGGEAFRVNFSIRLALSKILAQRAGTSLQLLIIDEGFGTQDADGCERLVSAINEIAPDFACILTVTHIPQFKEAFQQRIEVRKTNDGSEVYLVT